ncbi:MAG: hypothetical protein WC919_03005 [Candidatus Paceibacterota bacterium]|jgi:hypothetical protein
MGGERETTVSPTKAKNKTTIGDIRIHEANGEVHFHADTAKLKVAVPSGVWYRDWTRLTDQGGSCTFIDNERSTRLTVEVALRGDDFSEIDASLSITKIAMSDTFKALHEFTTGKK